MSLELCMSSVHRYFVELANGNLGAIGELLDSKAAAVFKEDFISFRAALPGYHFTVQHVAVQHDRVVVHWMAQGRTQEQWCDLAGDDLRDGEQESVSGIITYWPAGGLPLQAEIAPDSRFVMPQRQGCSTPAPVPA